jgi:hypothetical protein
MKILVRTLILSLMLVLVAFTMLARDNDKAGTTGATFLKLGVGARAAALGNSVVGSSSDAGALYWNPAALGMVRNTDVMISYDRWFEKMQHGFLGIAMPGSMGTTSLGVIYFNSGPMTRTEAAPGGGYVDKGEYSNTDAALLVGYGIRLFGETHFGLTVKGVYESLAGQSAFAFGGDAGIYSRIGIVDIGIVGRNFGSKLKFNDEAYALPLQILGGASVHLKEYGLTVSAMGGSVSEGQTQFSVGAEFNPLDFIALRVGYKTGLADVTGGMKGISGGLGLSFSDVRLDYAYNTLGDLGPTHHISLGFSIGKGGS